jgi:hypothetical protein
MELRHFVQPAFDMLDVLVCMALATISPALIEFDTPANGGVKFKAGQQPQCPAFCLD